MMNTSKRLAEVVKNEGSKIKGPSGTLDFYTLPLKVQSMKEQECKQFIFGKDFGKKNRTIIVLGATGAGKSTLVNRMINYILGVTFDDTFRFKLVDDGTAKSQAHSQTSNVTVYKLNHREGFQIDYSLTIVDTPGFGDTRGIETDRLIVTQLKSLFSAKHGVSEIDAICIVAQASLTRLTHAQKYVLDSVINIFGKDVVDNIRILVTFSDFKKPLVLNAIKESGVPCPKEENGSPIHFKFNNAENVDEDEGGDFDKIFWDKGTTNMENFFSAVNKIETRSLNLTKEVLKRRYQLQISMDHFKDQMNLSLAKLEEIKTESQHLQTHKLEITANSQYEYDQSVVRIVKVKSTEMSLNCKNCNSTCHKSCGQPAHYFCAVFKDHFFAARCKVCLQKCPVPAHVRENFYWGNELVTVKMTFEEKRKKYQKASEEAMSVEDVIKEMKLEYRSQQESLVKLMHCSLKCQNKLKDIALNPNHLSISEYIDMLIEGEKSAAKPGYNERINKLLVLKENDIAIGEVSRTVLAGQSSVGTAPSAKGTGSI